MTQVLARYLLAIAALFTLFASHDATGQDLRTLLDRLDRLERDISTLNVRMSGGKLPPVVTVRNVGDPLPKPAVAKLITRMDSLEQDLRTNTGTQETINHQLQLLSERLDKLVADFDYRFRVMEERQSDLRDSGAEVKTIAGTPTRVPAATGVSKMPFSGAQPGTLGTISLNTVDKNKGIQGGSNPVASTSVQAQKLIPTPVLPSGTPKEQYQYARNLYLQTNYDQAEIAFKQFIELHGGNPLAGNARFWLGGVFFNRADYKKAAQHYFESYQVNPKHAKAPDMLLRLGRSLAQLGKKSEACATFDKVAKDFAKVSARIKAALSRQRKRTGCP